MDEKNLLKEITYLSRLIGRHKHNLTTENKQIHSYSISGHKQYFKNVKLIADVPVVSGSKFSPSPQFQDVNTRQKGTISQQSAKSVVMQENASKYDEMSSLNLVQNTVGHSSNQQVDKQYEKVKSIHINPRYLSDSSQIHHIPAYVRSVHVNPKLISMNKENGSLKEINMPVCENTIKSSLGKKVPVHVNPKIIPVDRESGCWKEKIVFPVIENSSKALCNDSSPAPVSTRQPSSRRKVIYRSKTKLVKASGGLVGDEIKREEPCSSVSSFRAKCQVAKKVASSVRNDILFAVTRTKLVRVPKSKDSGVIDQLPAPVSCSTPVVLSSRAHKLRKVLFTSSPSRAVKIAKKVSSKYRSNAPQCSKYKVDHRVVKTPKPVKSGLTSRYQIDRRTGQPSFRVKKTSPRRVPSYSHLLFSPVRRTSYGNRVWCAPFTPVTKIKISHKKLSRIGSNRVSGPCTPNSALVRIGGVLYRTSPTQLTRSKPSGKMPAAVQKDRMIVRKRKLNAGHIVYVRGKKFMMDPSGKTLRRVVDKNSPLYKLTTGSAKNERGQIRRVDIGGVTFVQKTPTLLIRTNTHTARNVLSIAKQKSIAVLTKKMRKNNQVCLFYRRFGKCPRQKKGSCELIHDRKYVTICKKHLQGKCDKDCLLSHDIIPQKMPTCKFFLEGCCMREACPYVHVKVNAKAPLCAEFLKGYCPDGLVCLKRHFMVCPEFDKNEQCRKGKYCPYPHPRPAKVKRIPVENSKDNAKAKESPKAKRYYESDTFLEELKGPPETLEVLSPDNCSDDCGTPRKRPKLGDLPSFIALSSPSFC